MTVSFFVLSLLLLFDFRYAFVHHTQRNTIFAKVRKAMTFHGKRMKREKKRRQQQEKKRASTATVKESLSKKYTNDITNKRATNKITTMSAKQSAIEDENGKKPKLARRRRRKKLVLNRVIQHMDTCKSSSKVSLRFTVVCPS